MERKIRIVTDSSSDVLELKGVDFRSAPLKIITADKEYVDDAKLDVVQMAENMSSYKGRSSTSCPNVEDWLETFGDAKEIYCVTITGALSGSNNTACMAREMYLEEHPDAKVFVLDSKSTGPEIALILEKLRELVLEGNDFETICNQITEYSKKTGLLFMLESMKNLANNGRVSQITAKMAGLLGIRVVGKASDRGDLEMLDKCRGEKKAIETILERLHEFGLRDGKVKIGHCCNEGTGKALKELIQKKFEKVKVELYQCRGLCTFYAELGGLLVGFESN
ncbi:MAG: DegV family protein [Ruminococcaceae bacterium]|nr:DegV family protein [Oscillospiraceae bacterium]